jgi:hypothetical protein
MSKLSSIFIDSLRPNNSWLCLMWASDPKDRWKYPAIRLGFVALFVALMCHFPHKIPR